MSSADGELTSMALCWRLERADGAGLALTSHDEALTRDGVRYSPCPGITPASITRSLGLEPDAGEIAGSLNSDALSDEDLALGRWDGASARLVVTDWADAAAGPIALMGSEIGSVAIDGDGFTADLRGAAAKLDGAVCPSTSAECRAQFGDKDCRVDLAGRSIVARVIESDDLSLTLDRTVDDRYLFGRLRFLAGRNCGIANVILAASGPSVTLRNRPRASIEPGCRVELREGCDKRFATCNSRFGNAVNFRGEPHLPGNDLLTRYPGS